MKVGFDIFIIRLVLAADECIYIAISGNRNLFIDSKTPLRSKTNILLIPGKLYSANYFIIRDSINTHHWNVFIFYCNTSKIGNKDIFSEDLKCYFASLKQILMNFVSYILFCHHCSLFITFAPFFILSDIRNPFSVCFISFRQVITLKYTHFCYMTP